MPKICFIGAGSLGFTRNLVRDILTFPLLEGSTITLMDIDPERLDFAYRAVKRIVELGKHPAKVEATLNREEALKGADAVLCTILAAPVSVWRHDLEIPKKYGVDFNIGDTRGPAGIFRALRTIPVMLGIVKDMERLCPHAILLNYTNPMAMVCRAMQRESFIRLTGLCHSVQGTAEMLATWIGAPMSEITYTSAGINHQSFIIDYRWNDEDAYPLIHKAVTERPEIYNQEIVRNELFLFTGYYVTESSGHNSEYNWWFRKRPDIIESFVHGTGGNPGEYARSLKGYLRREDSWKADVQQWFDNPDISLARGHEYAAYIINARQGGEPYRFNGNVPNKGLITNLPPDVCVEVPVYADRNGFNAVHVGALPPQCAALVNASVASEEMAVEAALTGDTMLAYQSIAYDPLTAAVLSLREIKDMVREMLAVNKDYLPNFKSVEL